MLKDGVRARWSVESFDFHRHMQGIEYTVSETDDGHFHCTCDAFKFGQGTYCKHITWVMNNKDELVPDEQRSEDVISALLAALQAKGNVTIEVKHTANGGTEVKIIR